MRSNFLRNKVQCRKLNFLSQFENHDPDAYHSVDFEYARKWINGKKTLNIGCWTGSFEGLCSNTPLALFSVEPDVKALQVAKESNEHAHFINADACNLPFHTDSFDVVLMFTVLEHLGPNIHEVLKEIHRVLISGGNLILSTPHRNCLHGMMDIAHWMAGHRHFRIKEIREMLASAELSVHRIELKGRWISCFCIPFFYLFKYIYKLNLYKTGTYRSLILKEYEKPGFRDIYLIAYK